MNKKLKEIEKPWAIYHWSYLSWYIGKIIQESKWGCHLQYSEDQVLPSELWDYSLLKRFNTSLDTINFFFKNNPEKEKYYKKDLVIKTFLENFPSETKNLEKLLKLEHSQSKPKCTDLLKEEKDYLEGLKKQCQLDQGQASPL